MFEFMQDKNMEKSVELAKLVQRRTCAAANRPNKGVRQAGFLVLRETSMPSCLIELGFITTPSEEQQLNNPDAIDALGYGIYQAFVDYRNKYDKSITVPFEVPERQRVAEQKPREKKVEEEPQRAEETQTAEEPRRAEAPEAAAGKGGNGQEKQTAQGAPVFKIQILTSPSLIKKGDKRLKGYDDADYYKDGKTYKYLSLIHI